MTREIAGLRQPCKQPQALPSRTNHTLTFLRMTHPGSASSISHKSVPQHRAHLSAAFIPFVRLGHSTWGHGTRPNSTHSGAAGGGPSGLPLFCWKKRGRLTRLPPPITHKELRGWPGSSVHTQTLNSCAWLPPSLLRPLHAGELGSKVQPFSLTAPFVKTCPLDPLSRIFLDSLDSGVLAEMAEDKSK